uniref:REJ domain-containing protein n=1 Tax=Macrostomum lignano TaxID=282301 RepID=A0A1I8F6W7_9PLAT
YQPGSNPLKSGATGRLLFEAVKLSGGASEVSAQPQALCQVVTLATLNWSDISVSASVLVPSVNSTTGIFVAARIDKGGCAQTKKIKGGSFCLWLRCLGEVDAEFAERQVHGKDWKPNCRELGDAALASTPSTGFAGLGSENFGLACFANLSISSANSLPAKDDAQLKYKSAEQAAVVPMIRLVEAQRIDNFDHL